MSFLYEEINKKRNKGSAATLPTYIPAGLNRNMELRPYQKLAFENFITYFEGDNCPKPLQVLFHMATGSGKTLIMAGLILYLYKHGYRNFLFFVNLSNILEKTKENFLNPASSKYLFAEEIFIDGERVKINQVSNFQSVETDAINICFATTQGLHTDIHMAKEGGMTLEDFENLKVVLISDEAHHLNVETRRGRGARLSDAERESRDSWEGTVRSIFEMNVNNILLEFTATCDLNNAEILNVYRNKIIFNYPLAEFYKDKYSKDIVTMQTDFDFMDRAVQAIILSQYRLKVFQDHRLFVKPVILFKAKSISENKEMMTKFIDKVRGLNEEYLRHIAVNARKNDIMDRAFSYFETKGISLDMLAAELRDDFSEEHCVSANDYDSAVPLQIRLNTLEDADNPYRAVFEVKKLDEGWDVLNLFDIVRLYDTRQSGGQGISSATVSEAQLIGRGARYCPFQLDDEQPKHQRKYDDDMANELRICETLCYHYKDDDQGRYIQELKNALREIGLDPDTKVQREYKLKEKFTNDDLYTQGLMFLNRRIERKREDVHCLTPRIRDNIYRYRAITGTGKGIQIMEEDVDTAPTADVRLNAVHLSIKDIVEKVNYAIVNKALMKYPVYKFSTLKSHFPNIKSTREFITSGEYLGGVKIDIRSRDEYPTTETLYNAVLKVTGKVADYISKIEKTYEGTKEFNQEYVHDVFRNKTVNYTEISDNDGIGVSQKSGSVRAEWRIDLEREDWFAYTDNFGTSEEKAFVAYFKMHVKELKKIYSKIYLVRNERIFGIYSFDDGTRFEPDYVLFLQRDRADGYEQLQIFIEPKGEHLLEKDRWKEEFLLQLKEKAVAVKVFRDDNDYRIWGFHFFTESNRNRRFDPDFEELLNV